VNKMMAEQIRLPTKFEAKLIKALFKIPKYRNQILVNNGLKPKLDDLPKVEYICHNCQIYQNLPVWNEKWEEVDFDLELPYYCPVCDERMVQTETGEY
jgi:Zn finger protein HypA/HybF involved in hydrogenase expression